jgi:hypothetical protein
MFNAKRVLTISGFLVVVGALSVGFYNLMPNAHVQAAGRQGRRPDFSSHDRESRFQ